jgi:hypothetical protein
MVHSAYHPVVMFVSELLQDAAFFMVIPVAPTKHIDGYYITEIF